MSRWSILLRLLLCLALVLNGTGAAAGGIQAAMPAPSAMHHHSGTVVASMARDAMPCHQHHRAGHVASTANPSTHDGHPASTDCCKSSTCQCAFAQATPAAALADAVFRIDPERAYSARAQKAGHLAPELPHLIRPPIG